MARIKHVPYNTGGSSLRIQPRPEPIVCRQEEEEASRKQRVCKSRRAELVFPVTRVSKWLKRKKYTHRAVQSASVYMTSVLGYLAYKLLKLAGGFVMESQKTRIEPRHLLQIVKRNDEFSKLLGLSTVNADGGVVAHMHPELWPRPSKPTGSRSATKPRD